MEDEEPIYVAMTGEHWDSGLDWFDARAKEARDQGATFFRYSHDEPHKMLLIEGWKIRPNDQGEQRWMFAAPETKGSK